jgi:hypothetical protein
MDYLSGFNFDIYRRSNGQEKYEIQDGRLILTGTISDDFRKMIKNRKPSDSFGKYATDSNRIFNEQSKKTTLIDGDHPKFFLKMMEVDYTNDNDILNFYTKYTQLDAWRLDYDLHDIDIDMIRDYDTIEEARRAFQYFQCAFKLNKAISEKDVRSAFIIIFELYRKWKECPHPDYYHCVEDVLEVYFDDEYQDGPEGMNLIRALLKKYEIISDDSFDSFIEKEASSYIQEVKSKMSNQENWFLKGQAWERMNKEINKNHIDKQIEIISKLLDANNSVIIKLAKEFTTFLFNLHIKSVDPIMEYSTHAFGRFRTRIPLSAIYFECFFNFCKGSVFRLCKNPTCGKYFEIYGADERKIFCTHKCANLFTVRNKRKAERERKHLIKKEGDKDGIL